MQRAQLVTCGLPDSIVLRSTRWRHRPTMAAALALVLGACNPVVVRVGERSVTQSEIRQRFDALDAEGKAAAKRDFHLFVLSLVQDDALASEAQRLSLVARGSDNASRAQAMLERITKELADAISDDDLGEEELLAIYKDHPVFRYNPARVLANVMVWHKQEDAARAIRESSGVVDPHTDKFRALFARLQSAAIARDGQSAAAATENWDVYLVHGNDAWPAALVDAAFAGKPGAVLGPIKGTSSRYEGARYFVAKVIAVYGEENSFSKVKPRLRDDARAARVAKLLPAEVRKHVQAVALVDDTALQSTRARLP